MKKKFLMIVFMCLIFCSCEKNNNVVEEDTFKVGYSTNLLTNDEKTELRKVFNEKNISNIDLFFELVDDFNKEEDMGCGIKDWNKTESFIYNDTNCTDRYEKNHDISDGNCRLTAFALIQDKLKINNVEKDYGSYLMFDMDVLENNKEYEILKNKQLEFINIFNEMDVSNIKEDEYKNVFPNKLKDYEFKLDNENVSLISVVMNDNDFKLLFVGHSGILIDLKDKYLFVEKIAFEQPYQVSVLKSKEDLALLFKNRKTYFGDGNEKGPFIYENDKLLYEY